MSSSRWTALLFVLIGEVICESIKSVSSVSNHTTRVAEYSNEKETRAPFPITTPPSFLKRYNVVATIYEGLKSDYVPHYIEAPLFEGEDTWEGWQHYKARTRTVTFTGGTSVNCELLDTTGIGSHYASCCSKVHDTSTGGIKKQLVPSNMITTTGFSFSPGSDIIEYSSACSNVTYVLRHKNTIMESTWKTWEMLNPSITPLARTIMECEVARDDCEVMWSA
ncbi:hypothetical protein EJ08DRAFT_389464 [Tothia fuscella]|uniref:Uncharacterized protein n=1 Tax=Tothia fuscella TaxID=1048955 RepID=A0A9P4P0N4_9PEZI|nr:hypothetical protein EJ08DRAFT_389464 [Tothia fuscella]